MNTSEFAKKLAEHLDQDGKLDTLSASVFDPENEPNVIGVDQENGPMLFITVEEA